MKTLRWSSSILRLASVLPMIILALTASQHAKAQQCPPPQIITLSASTNWSKCGYTAFISDSSGLDHYYLLEDQVTDINLDTNLTFAGGGGPAILHGHVVFSNSVPGCSLITNSADGTCGFSQFNCDSTVAVAMNGVLSSNDVWEITNTSPTSGVVSTSEENWFPGETDFGYSDLQPFSTTGPIYNHTTTNLTSVIQRYLVYCDDGTNATTTTLSSEYTDAMLAANISANMPAYPTAWATNVYSMAFFLWNDTGHSSATGGKTKYFFHYCPCIKDETYLFEWTQKTVFADPNKVPVTVPFSEKVTSDGNSANGVVTSTHTIDVPAEPCTISESPATVTIVPTPSPPGSGGPGGPGPGPKQ